MTDFLASAQQHRAVGNFEAAYQHCLAKARLEPSGQAWDFLGQSLHGMNRFYAAVAAFRRGDEGYESLLNLGWNLHVIGRSEEGEPYLRRSSELAPKGDPLPFADLSQCLLRLGRIDEAVSVAREAVKRSDEPMHRIALAMSLFGAGKWAEAFSAYEARIPYKLTQFLGYPYPRWDGSAVDCLFVQAEMGIGDCLWMLRYVPLAAARVKRLLLFVHHEIFTLVTAWAKPLENVEVQAMPRELPAADAYVPIVSLPVTLGCLDRVSGEPYLFPGSKDEGPARRIGIAWTSSPDNEEAPWRDIPLLEFMPLFEMPEVELHSLQFGPAAQQIGQLGLHGILRDRSPEISSMEDTLRVLSGLDLLITCDSSLVHLGGAMGKRVWLLRNALACPWIWPYEGGQSEWYDSVDVMVRRRGEDWGDLLRCVAERVVLVNHAA